MTRAEPVAKFARGSPAQEREERNMPEVMEAKELALCAIKQNPGKRFAVDKTSTALAVWNGERWEMFAGLLITGRWCRVPNLILCETGKPVVDGWVEVLA